jgi:signal transduction histidine kinase
MLRATMKQEAARGEIGQFYRYVRQHLAEGLLLLNEQAEIVFANLAAAQLLGYETNQLTGCAYRLVQPQGDAPAAGLWETTLRHQDGRFIPVRLTITPLPQGQLISILDLRQLEQFSQALIHTQRLAGVGTMTSSVAHEITNPLSIITNTCSNLSHEIQHNNLDTERLHYYIDMIEQSAWRCVRIVEALRNYTYNGDQTTAVTDLNMIVAESLRLVEQQFLKEFNVTIETVLDQQLKSIVCDHDRLIQVVINLLTNACQSMQPQGGSIRIKTWVWHNTTPNGTTNAAANGTANGAYYALSVRDSGSGIKPQIMADIFEPFFTTRASGKGTGLGLFIAREIVNQHNGRIWAENNLDGGATFTVLLPQR